MIDVNLDGTPPNKVSRIAPEISVDASGNITWVPAYTDYNADAYYRGKTVTNQEFNELLLKDVYQGNYITDTLVEIFNTHLGTSIERYFKSIYNLIPSYVKKINPTSWGELQKDGYYYITIPAAEHGFKVTESDKNSGQTNIDIEMYLIDLNGNFHEVMQYMIDEENTVTLYGDDSTLTGFIVVRTNDKSYALAEPHIDATQVTGLASVATSGNYTDLINRPDSAISDNTTNIAGLLSGTIKAAKAKVADSAVDANNVSSSIQNIPIENIFETGSSFVKNATNATNATKINGLALKQDVNGVLRIGNIIIPQKQILWNAGIIALTESGTYCNYTTIKLTKGEINIGDWLEIKLAFRAANSNEINYTDAVKFKVLAYSSPSSANSVNRFTWKTALSTSLGYSVQINVLSKTEIAVSNGMWYDPDIGKMQAYPAQYFEIAKLIE